jgi:RNA polymerase sigma-70 factor (ECF subfamily)
MTVEGSPLDGRERLYDDVLGEFGPALSRLARGYERDEDRRADLLQDIHLAIWRSLAVFDGRCSLRTWIYRVAHNTATSVALRRSRRASFVSLDEAELVLPAASDADLDRHLALQKVIDLVQSLRNVDRQVMLLYLEGCDAAAIADVVGLSPGNVATKIHRIKQILTEQFQRGVRR